MTKRTSFLLVTFFLFVIISLSLASAGPNDITATVNPNVEIGQIRGDFYGFVTGVNPFYSMNVTWEKEKLLETKAKTGRAGMSIDYYYSGNISQHMFNRTRNPNEFNATMKFFYENNITLVITASNVPDWLANKTDGYCLSPWTSCRPYNYTTYAMIVVDMINYTTNGGLYIDKLELEIGNEPYSDFWLNNLDDDTMIKATEFMKLYNNVSAYVRSKYPTLKIMAPSTFREDVNLTNTFLSGNSGNTVILSHHPYDSWTVPYDKFDWLVNDTRTLFNKCGYYNVNCERVVLSEWGVTSPWIKNQTANESQYRMVLSTAYSSILNVYPANVSLELYRWTAAQNYSNRTFVDYPNRYVALLQKEYSDTSQDVYFAPFNVTKAYASNHKALDTVISSNSSRSDIKIVASKDTLRKHITITNTNSTALNVSITITGAGSGSYRDVDTGASYQMTNGVISVQNLAGYGVLTLEENKAYITVQPLISRGTVRSDFYGANINGFNWFTNNAANATLKAEWLNLRLGTMRIDAALQNRYSNKTGLTSAQWDAWDGVNMSNPTNIALDTELITWAKNNNQKVLIILDHMPQFLADNSSGMCLDLRYCPATNYSKLGNIFLDYYNRIGCNSSFCYVEIWNEPYNTFFMGKLGYDNITKASNYTKMYNALASYIKANDSNIKVGGPSGKYNTWNLIDAFLRDVPLANRDFISMHDYDYNNYNTFAQSTQIEKVRANCTALGVSCGNWFIESEWNIASATLQNNSVNYRNYSSAIALSYWDLLTRYPANVTSVFYRFHENSKYNSSYTDYPYRWAMFSSSLYDGEYYAGYNITKMYGTYHAAGNTILNTTSDDDSVKVVGSSHNGYLSVTLTNTNTSDKEVELGGLSSVASTLIDVESGTIYDVSDGNATLEVTSYDVMTLTEPVFRQSGGDWFADNYDGEEIRELTNDEASELGLVDTHQGIGSTCDNTTLSFYEIILNLAAMALIGYVFYWGLKDGVEDLDVQKALIMGIGLIVGVILFQISADNLGIAGC